MQRDFNAQVSRVATAESSFSPRPRLQNQVGRRIMRKRTLTKSFLDAVANPENDLNKDSLVQVSELDIGLTEGIKRLTSGGRHAQSTELGDSIKNLSLARYSTN